MSSLNPNRGSIAEVLSSKQIVIMLICLSLATDPLMHDCACNFLHTFMFLLHAQLHSRIYNINHFSVGLLYTTDYSGYNNTKRFNAHGTYNYNS